MDAPGTQTDTFGKISNFVQHPSDDLQPLQKKKKKKNRKSTHL